MLARKGNGQIGGKFYVRSVNYTGQVVFLEAFRGMLGRRTDLSPSFPDLPKELLQDESLKRVDL